MSDEMRLLLMLLFMASIFVGGLVIIAYIVYCVVSLFNLDRDTAWKARRVNGAYLSNYTNKESIIEILGYSDASRYRGNYSIKTGFLALTENSLYVLGAYKKNGVRQNEVMEIPLDKLTDMGIIRKKSIGETVFRGVMLVVMILISYVFIKMGDFGLDAGSIIEQLIKVVAVAGVTFGVGFIKDLFHKRATIYIQSMTERIELSYSKFNEKDVKKFIKLVRGKMQ